MTQLRVGPNPLRGAATKGRAIAKSGAGAGPWVIGASIAGIAVAAGIVVYLLYKKHALSCTCADGTPCPNNDPTQCKGGSGGTGGGGSPFPTSISANPSTLIASEVVIQQRGARLFSWACCGSVDVQQGNVQPLYITVMGHDASGNTVPLSGIPVSASASVYSSAQGQDQNASLTVTASAYTNASGVVGLNWQYSFAPTADCTKGGGYTQTSDLGLITVSVTGASLSVTIPVKVRIDYTLPVGLC